MRSREYVINVRAALCDVLGGEVIQDDVIFYDYREGSPEETELMRYVVHQPQHIFYFVTYTADSSDADLIMKVLRS